LGVIEGRGVRVIGDPVLRRKAQTVTEFGEGLKQFAIEMYEEMIDADGIGLAAPQIGVLKRFLVVGMPDDETDMLTLSAYANPEVIDKAGSCTMEEGCLSIPGVREDVERPERILLRWQDLDGNTHEKWFDDLEARVIQHEMDHLEGVLFTDRISPTRKLALKRRLDQIAQRA
jgi:peptide deformylase